MAIVSDIAVSEQFIEDYDAAPTDIKQFVDSFIRKLLDAGRFTPGMNAHKSAAHGDLWIGYITRSGAHWRVTFSLEGPCVHLDRLLSHDKMDTYLRALS